MMSGYLILGPGHNFLAASPFLLSQNMVARIETTAKKKKTTLIAIVSKLSKHLVFLEADCLEACKRKVTARVIRSILRTIRKD